MVDRRPPQEWREPRTKVLGTPMKSEVIGLSIAMLIVWVVMSSEQKDLLAWWLWFPFGWIVLTRPWRLLPYLHHHRAVQAAQQEAAMAEQQAKHEAARAEDQARRGYL